VTQFTEADLLDRFEEPTPTQYAELGRYVAATMATGGTSPAGILNQIDGWLRQHWGYAQHPRNVTLLPRWEAVADDLVNGVNRDRETAAAHVAEQTICAVCAKPIMPGIATRITPDRERTHAEHQPKET
jgi:hypothetical protein